MSFSAIGSSLLTTFLVDFTIQLVFYIISAILKTEVLYDLSGALTYATCVIVALVWRRSDQTDPTIDNGISSLAARQIIVAVLVLVWCARLGGFLFLRVLRTPDKRFDELKENFVKFSIPWVLQVVWIFLTAFAAFCSRQPSGTQRSLIWSDYVGLAIWLFGFTFETTADFQKQIFKNKFPRDFIQTGVWRYSRYANYFGEVTLWTGMFVLCTAGFAEAWQWVAIVSPVFVFCLIYFVSGVRLLEESSEKRYGANPDYQVYKARTPKFIPWIPKKDVIPQITSRQLPYHRSRKHRLSTLSIKPHTSTCTTRTRVPEKKNQQPQEQQFSTSSAIRHTLSLPAENPKCLFDSPHMICFHYQHSRRIR
ncbi:hypothetical protein BC829DRAFT_362396 [Chytridium lagenaria]|nr:hypothetical protein BC829DRAFT_362396 [Chytridium lagenaria]